MGDPQLRAMMLLIQPPAPLEEIVEHCMLETILTPETRDSDCTKYVARLACGHKVITSNLRKARCFECHRMIMEGEDYESFRNRK